MKTEKINTISGEQLMKLDLPPMKYIVSGIMPQGMHVVSGPSKIGKSWLGMRDLNPYRLTASLFGAF